MSWYFVIHQNFILLIFFSFFDGVVLFSMIELVYFELAIYKIEGEKFRPPKNCIHDIALSLHLAKR